MHSVGLRDETGMQVPPPSQWLFVSSLLACCHLPPFVHNVPPNRKNRHYSTGYNASSDQVLRINFTRPDSPELLLILTDGRRQTPARR
jgi:hypothetical protein